METLKKGENRSAVLEKAVDIAKTVHAVAVWTISQQRKVAIDVEREMPAFYKEWLRSEIKRLWDIELLPEEAEYLWLKATLGF